MATSQNGWPVDPPRVPLTVGGVSFPGGVAAGAAAQVLGYVAAQFHARVEKLVPGHCWAYANRPIRGQGTGYSNHASGTAIDLNAPEHPRGVRGTFTAAQVKVIRSILAEVGPAVRWGGDYTSGPIDEMHFELNAKADTVAAVAQRLQRKGKDDEMTKEQWDYFERFAKETHRRIKVLDDKLVELAAKLDAIAAKVGGQ